VVRVEELVPEAVWGARYDQINAFERLLAGSGVTILKFFLHISKEEQKGRFQERLDRPEKNWKFNPADLETRSKWDDYMRAFEVPARVRPSRRGGTPCPPVRGHPVGRGSVPACAAIP